MWINIRKFSKTTINVSTLISFIVLFFGGGFAIAAVLFGISDNINILTATLGGVLGGGIISVLSQNFWTYLQRPRLKLSYDQSPACEAWRELDSTRANTPKPERVKRLRIMVNNNGSVSANDCRVFITYIYRRDAEGKPYSNEDFRDTLPLFWSVRNKETKENILPGIDYTVDCLKVTEVGTDIKLELETPFTPIRYEEITSGPGRFKLRVVVAASNAEPDELVVHARWDGSLSSLVWEPRK